MSRSRKIAVIVLASLAGLLLVLFVAGVIIVQTPWFREMVRTKIISAVEESTGGRVEIGAFTFHPRLLRAGVRDFVIHGTEPAGVTPLFRARMIQVDLKLGAPLERTVDISYLLVDSPQANVIVYPDGRTNIPAPKIPHKSDKTALQTIVDMAIGRFELRNGKVTFADRQLKTPLNARGENLRAQLSFNTVTSSYGGRISISPLYAQSERIDVSVPIAIEKDKIQVTDAKITTRESQIVISGAMDHLVAPRTSAYVKARISLEEVKRAAGDALPPLNTGGNLPRILTADAGFDMDDNRIRVSALRLGLGQSGFEASGTLKDVSRAASLKFNGTLALGELGRLFRMGARPEGTLKIGGNAGLAADEFRVTAHVDARGLSAGQQRLPYAVVIAGPVEAHGNVRAPSEMIARANLALAPAGRGIPMSGRINADYNGRAGTVNLEKSYIALPNTRLDLSGSLNREIQVRLVSRNLNDLAPALRTTSLPVKLNRGAATLTGAVRGKLSAPEFTGHLEVTNFSVQERPFRLLTADLAASPSGAAVRNGLLARGSLQAQFSAAAGLRDFKPEPRQPLTASLSVRNADVRDILALAGRANEPFSGNLTAAAQITGTIGDPRGNVSVDVVNGSAYQERFDQLQMRAVLSKQLIEVPTLRVTAGKATLAANAAYTHAENDLQRGVVRAHVAGNQIQLSQFRPELGGIVQLVADASASVQPQRVDLTSLNGSFSARNLQREGKNLGDLTASAQTAGANLNFQLKSDFAGSTIHATGQSLLRDDHPTTANLSIARLPIEQVLFVAGRRDIPAAGMLDASAKLSGTLADPHAGANLTVTGGMAYDEPFDRLQASILFSNQLVEVPSLVYLEGPNRVDFSASFAHPRNDYENGQVRFRMATNRVQLDRIRRLQRIRPGLAGTLEAKADGAATLRRGAAPLIAGFNADISTAGMTIQKKPAGNLTVTASTRGSTLTFQLKSDFAQADIRGAGQVELRGDYPASAELAFANLTYSGLQPWLRLTARPTFQAVAEGSIKLTGPVEKPENLTGTFQLTKLQANSVTAPGQPQPRRLADLHNEGPIVIAFSQSAARVQSAHIAGTYTDLNLTGTAGLRTPMTLNLRAKGNIRLELLEALHPDVFSAGNIALDATVQGTPASPLLDGRVALENASFHVIGAPNGITDANGTIIFNRQRALVQNITGTSGGGKITLAGYVGYAQPQMDFRIQATAEHVRVAYPANVGSQASAALNLTGATNRSLLSGSVTIEDVAIHSHTDIGSILSGAPAPPPRASQAKTGLAGGMRFDVRVDTAPGAQFRTTLAQNIQGEAHLRLRGTPDNPGMLGRANITQGQVILFGNKFNIDQGSVAFYNPQKIEPIVNIDLQTTAKGINVALNVSGPADRLKLAYHSDPPMQFSDLVALLASGKLPTTDPVLAARQPPPQQQSFQQRGASAILDQAVAAPVSGRLQRLFGVNKLKIDPQIIGAQNTPQARLTLEQQISKTLTFTYIQDVTASNPQIVRVQWDIDPTWAAILERQENGEVGLDIFYKKRFR